MAKTAKGSETAHGSCEASPSQPVTSRNFPPSLARVGRQHPQQARDRNHSDPRPSRRTGTGRGKAAAGTPTVSPSEQFSV